MPSLRRAGRRWALPPQTHASNGTSLRILGLDPGSQATGYGVVDWRSGQARFVACGTIRTRGTDFLPRLRQIFDGVQSLMREYSPDEIAVERVFMHRNADSALKLGQARGAALCAALCSAQLVYEYAPREVKLAVVGQGGAEKQQVQMMVRTLLHLEGDLKADSADAIGLALCHAYSRATRATLVAAGGRGATR